MILLPIHDVHQPVLDQMGVFATVATNHRDLQLFILVADDGDWRDKELVLLEDSYCKGVGYAYSSAGSEGFNYASCMSSLRKLIHSVITLDDLKWLYPALVVRESFTSQLQDASSCDAVENDLVA